MTEVPNVIGQTLGDADSTLHDVGFRTTHRLVPDALTEENVVINQAPRGGTIQQPQTVVTLTASGGPPPPPLDTTPPKFLTEPGLGEVLPADEPAPGDREGY